MTDKDQNEAVEALNRIGKVLGAIYASTLHELDNPSKAAHLQRCGFSNVEIADLLGSTANAIGVALHKSRGDKKSRRRKKAKNESKKN